MKLTPLLFRHELVYFIKWRKGALHSCKPAVLDNYFVSAGKGSESAPSLLVKDGAECEILSNTLHRHGVSLDDTSCLLFFIGLLKEVNSAYCISTKLVRYASILGGGMKIESNRVYEDEMFPVMVVKNELIENVTFVRCKMRLVKFWKCTLKNVFFEDCSLGVNVFAECSLENVVEKDCASVQIDYKSGIKDYYGIRGVVHVAEEDFVVWKRAEASPEHVLDEEVPLSLKEKLVQGIYEYKILSNYTNVIVKCMLRKGTKYVFGENGKARAEALDVVEIYGKEYLYSEARSHYDFETRYIPGQTVRPRNLGNEELDVNETCAPGIHFYFKIDRALRYNL